VESSARRRRQAFVRDPSVPRLPGGTGEQLGLTWWAAVALEGSDGSPAALWGYGSRDGGRPVPREEMIGVLAEGAVTDLAEEREQGAFRARLALL
jgi:hypothetical protein